MVWASWTERQKNQTLLQTAVHPKGFKLLAPQNKCLLLIPSNPEEWFVGIILDQTL